MFLFILILSLVVAFLQTTLLPTLKIAGGVIQLGTIVIIIMMFFRSLRYASVFLLLSAIFLAIFSQMPIIYFLLPNFLILLLLAFLIDKRILAKPGTLPSFFLFFAVVILADLFKMLIFWSFSLKTIYTVLPDAIYSAIVATIIYYFANRIWLYFNPQVTRELIKMK